MDRRVFQPRSDSSAERRRNAIGMSVLILAAGWLWLLSHSHPAAAPARGPVARPVSKD